MNRAIQPGDVIIRFLMPFSVWHYGIVIKVDSQKLDDILMLEFADGDSVTRISMREFIYGRIYIWIDDFDYERKLYGNIVFYPMQERVKRALKIAGKGGMSYTINKYNCEYFARKCVFNDKSLWKSRQTEVLGETKTSVYGKIALLFTYGILKNHIDTSRWESRLKPTKYKYVVCTYCGSFHNGDLDNYDVLKCNCGKNIKLH